MSKERMLKSVAKLVKVIETDPTGKKPFEMGAKLDLGKVAIMRGCFHYFPRALEAVAVVSTVGAEKYAWKSWEQVPEGIIRYGDAMARHIVKEETEGPYDHELATRGHQILHAAQSAWNALARLELILREKEQQNEHTKRTGDGNHKAKAKKIRNERH